MIPADCKRHGSHCWAWWVLTHLLTECERRAADLAIAIEMIEADERRRK